jgi:hypothetical protein
MLSKGVFDMNRISRLALVLAITLLITGIVVSHSPATPASAASWTIVCTTNIAGSDRNLWPDTAGPGINNEGGFFYFWNKSIANESCTALAYPKADVSTTTYQKLKVRAAVNDGARFKVQVLEQQIGGEFCQPSVLVGTISWSDTEDHSGFLTKEITLPAGKNICLVKVVIDDYPNSIATGRTNALIDDIRIWNGISSGWRETFSAAPP